jgi:hypothetical protein
MRGIQTSKTNVEGRDIRSMSRTRLLMFAALLLLLALPAGPAFAQTADLDFSGTAVVSDDAALSDKITFTMSGVPAPTSGTEYVGWLVTQTRKLSTGAMSVNADNEISNSFDATNARYTGENLIHNFGTVVITEETAGDDPDQPAGPAVYSASIPAGAMAHIRHLVSNWPPGSGVGILTNLQLELDLALTHANLAKASFDAGDLAGVKQYLEHTINIIEGPDGPNYGDRDGDGSVQHPGGGLGVLFHAADRKHAGFAVGTTPDEADVVAHGALVDEYGANAAEWATDAVNQALKILDTTSLAVAGIFLGPGGNTVISFLDAALNGNSLSGDGGAKQAYTEGQLMATYTLKAGGPAEGEVGEGGGAVGVPASVGDPSVPAAAQIALTSSAVLLLVGAATLYVQRRQRAGV